MKLEVEVILVGELNVTGALRYTVVLSRASVVS